jgi:hypothetical protein
MATTTYEPIATYTAPSAQSSYTFSSIPSSYTDLVLVVQPFKSTSGGGTLRYQVNGDTGTNYSNTTLFAEAGTVYSDRASNSSFGRIGFWNGNSTGNVLISHFQNYSNTTTFKTVLSRAGNASAIVGTVVNLWRSTSAINSIYIYNDGGNFNTGSTFTLYGIANADIGAKATGGVITYDSTYFYHTFGASGTFTPKQSLTADILVVAGGGGGAAPNYSGGGGAGGFRVLTSQSLTTTAYTCTVGAGGASQSTTGVRGNNGVNSSFAGSGFSTITSSGGGGGAGDGGPSTGASGGSGGGNYTNDTGSGGAGNVGSYFPVEGFAGGRGGLGLGGGGGGGGGASEIGGTDFFSFGGDGTSAYSSWGLATGTGENVSGTVYYAGGGGGGAGASGSPVNQNTATDGGLGGGGKGASYNIANNTAGLANTGGGGGGVGGTSGNGAAGGSGIVIVRYAR